VQPTSPFRNTPPTSVKIDLAAVQPATQGSATNGKRAAWWSVTPVKELLPPIGRGNAAVKEALKQMHWEGSGSQAASGLAAALQRHPSAAGWGVFVVAAAGAVLRHVVR